MDYYHYAFICPYFIWDTEDKVGCEGKHSIKFDSAEDAKKYMKCYCASWKWESCPHAEDMNKKYEGRKKEMATTISELKGKINEQNLKIKNLRGTVSHLTEQHAEDQRLIKRLRERMQEKLDELQQAMTEIYCKSICMEHGEDVVDDETGEVIGKRLVFKALRENDLKLNMSEDIFYPEDEKYISTITIAVTYPEKGEEDED